MTSTVEEPEVEADVVPAAPPDRLRKTVRTPGGAGAAPDVSPRERGTAKPVVAGKASAPDRSAGVRGGAAPRVSRARLPWILALAGLIGTVGFGAAWLSARNRPAPPVTAANGPTAQILTTARTFARALTNFDGATVDRDFNQVTAMATGQFRTQTDQFFSTDIRLQLKKAQASSRGEIRDAFVQSADANHGSVFIVVDQTIANNLSPQPQADTLRMEVGLVRNGKAWMIESVNVLTAPVSGTGATSTPASTPSSVPAAGH